jgi:ankyrin repeat protein
LAKRCYLLHEAARKGSIEAVKQYLASGANVNAKMKNGNTSLHLANRLKEHKEITELLIAKGADVNAKDKEGRIPLDWVIKCNHPETADLLRKHGGKRSAELKAEGR